MPIYKVYTAKNGEKSLKKTVLFSKIRNFFLKMSNLPIWEKKLLILEKGQIFSQYFLQCTAPYIYIIYYSFNHKHQTATVWKLNVIQYEWISNKRLTIRTNTEESGLIWKSGLLGNLALLCQMKGKVYIILLSSLKDDHTWLFEISWKWFSKNVQVIYLDNNFRLFLKIFVCW